MLEASKSANVTGQKIFTMSEEEARRMRRGVFLPALLILPMAAMFGFDQSKSQPMHFLMVFSVALGIAAAVVSISWYGAKRRIDEFSRTTLMFAGDGLVWESALGRSELKLSDVTAVSIQKTRGAVRSIALTRTGTTTTLEGYNSMEVIAGWLEERLICPISTTNSWLSI